MRLARYWSRIGLSIAAFVFVFAYCEIIIYYLKIGTTCSFPSKGNSPAVKALMIADTHLLGRMKGHWLDKLRREWQMWRSFESAVQLLSPDVVFFLGDALDEGQWTDRKLFFEYADRFSSLFSNSSTKVYVLPGNHDLGFHYALNPHRINWFREWSGLDSADVVIVEGFAFVTVNSMALHGDGCRLCAEAEEKIKRIGERLRCKHNQKCVRPILLQHFPLFRHNDSVCIRDEHFDEDDKTRNETFRSGWEGLSNESTQHLIAHIRPRAVFDGHTHRGCTRRWDTATPFVEYTLNSFSWRNGNKPTFFMVTVSDDDVAVDVCYLPIETTVIGIYCIAIVAILLAAYFIPRGSYQALPVLKSD